MPSGPEDGSADQAEELRRWMAGESTLMAWLEEDPERQTTFYSDTPDVLDLDPELKERIANYEAEIAQLRKLASAGGGDAAGTSAEVARLSAEVARLTKVNSSFETARWPQRRNRSRTARRP